MANGFDDDPIEPLPVTRSQRFENARQDIASALNQLKLSGAEAVALVSVREALRNADCYLASLQAANASDKSG